MFNDREAFQNRENKKNTFADSDLPEFFIMLIPICRGLDYADPDLSGSWSCPNTVCVSSTPSLARGPLYEYFCSAIGIMLIPVSPGATVPSLAYCM